MGAKDPKITELEGQVTNLTEELETAKAEIADLTGRLEAETTAKTDAENKRKKAENELKAAEVSNVPKNFKGFIIPVGDPYVDGVKRFLNKTEKVGKISGDLCVRYSSKYAEKALKNYILRASGAEDNKRVAWAQEELKKV